MISRDRTIAIAQVLNVVTFLIALIVSLSVSIYLDPLIPALFLMFFVWAAVCEYRKRFIPRILLTIASVIIIGLYVYRFRSTADLAPLTVETLLMLLAVKLLEKKQFRDYAQIYLIALFLLAGAALLGISLAFLSYALVLIFLFNGAMILVTYYREDPRIALSVGTLERILWKGSLIPLCAIPLGALIFVVTPRTPFPLLDFLNQKNGAVTGFSDHVSLGKVSDIQEDGRPIFRVAMGALPDGDLYWRGIVLDYFDGSTWKSMRRDLVPDRPVIMTRLQGAVWQDVYLEPYGNTYLFGLDRPSVSIFRGVRQYGDGTFRSDEALGRKIRYRVASRVQPDPDVPASGLERYLQMPADISLAIIQLAQRMKSKEPKESLDAILSFLNSKDFSYSLRNLPVTGKPLDEFLFNLRYGNCEYFASAFAVLARLEGIPARLVAGYQGGLYNDLGRYYLVSQKQAHVWVEVYLPGKGWVRYDPTPGAQDLGKKLGMSVFERARLYLDMVNYYWIAFVVNYDVEKQFILFSRARTAVGETGFAVGQVPFKKLGILLVILSIVVFALMRIGRSLRRSDVERLIDAFTTCIQKAGHVKEASQGLEEFVATITDDRVRERAAEFVRRFESTYYADKVFSPEEIRALRDVVKELARVTGRGPEPDNGSLP